MDQLAGDRFTEEIDVKVTDFGKFDIVPALDGSACDSSQNSSARTHEQALESDIVFVHVSSPMRA
jgi:hypothetical protein